MPGSGIAAIVLAAGGARRMGTPKMLCPLHGRPLVRHAVDAVLGSMADTCCVVAGDAHAGIRAALRGTGARVVHHPGWEAGMASSLRAGLAAVGACEAVIVVLGDQPRLTAPIVDALIAQHRAGAPIVACDHGGGVSGPPVLFDRSRLGALRALEGDHGARALLRDPAVERVPFPGGRDDVDTTADLARLEAAPGGSEGCDVSD